MPVMMVDPDGEFGFIVAGLALFNAIRSGVKASNNGGTFWGSFGRSLAFSAINYGISAGVGEIFGAVGATSILGSKGLGELARAGTHALAGGGISRLRGGDFWQGAAAGGLGSATGSAFSKSSPSLQIGAASAAGGIGAELTGGDFLDGAIQSGISATANHVRHSLIKKGKIAPRIFINKLRKIKGLNYSQYLNQLRTRLIENGFNKRTRVESNSLGGRLKAWWVGAPTATVTMRNFKLVSNCINNIYYF